ncbi:MAG TPA: CsbD family protein [Pilimelia sp.]|nr:CsbD family protein [Pilimelia sp.]
MSARTDDIKARVKHAAGVLTGNRKWERDGRADRRAAEAKRRLARTRGKVDDVLDEATGAVEDTIDAVKESWRRG